MGDDLRAELHKAVIGSCESSPSCFRRGAAPFEDWSLCKFCHSAINAIDRVLGRHPEPAAPSETDGQRVIAAYYSQKDGCKKHGEGHGKICLRCVHELVAQVRAEHAKQVAPSEREKRLEALLRRYVANDHVHQVGCDELTEEAESLLDSTGEKAKEA